MSHLKLHFALRTSHCSLHTPHFTLHTSHCTLRTHHFTSHCALKTPHFTLHTSHFSLLSSHSTLHTSQSTLHTSHFSLLSSHSTLHTSHSTLHTALFTPHASHCTLHTPHFISSELFSPYPSSSRLICHLSFHESLPSTTTEELVCAVRHPGPCVRALCEAVAVLLSKSMTCARPRCNATSIKHFPHTSHCILHTSHLHFTLHTSTHLKSCELFSPPLSSSHVIPSLLTCHLK